MHSMNMRSRSKSSSRSARMKARSATKSLLRLAVLSALALPPGLQEANAGPIRWALKKGAQVGGAYVVGRAGVVYVEDKLITVAVDQAVLQYGNPLAKAAMFDLRRNIQRPGVADQICARVGYLCQSKPEVAPNGQNVLSALGLSSSPGASVNPSDDPSKQARAYQVKKPGLSGKEAANDPPSWARGERPYVGENGKEFAGRLCDAKDGPGKYDKGPTSDYNKIKKWGDRAFQNP